MDFFAMKRKKLQSLCKKHRIPANKTNEEMAKELSLIYKQKEVTNDGKEKGGTFNRVDDKEKLNVEIIDLEFESDDTNKVQLEASVIRKFLAMKREKLQSLCKKHGIPANKKSKEMAEKLSLIYKGKEEDPITIEDTDDEKEKGIGKFLAMKREKLRSLGKKHGIPANWTSKKMAEELSLIYKEKEGTDDGKEKRGTFDSVNDKDKLNVIIIDLESQNNDTNINVQMEASDNAPGKESNADGKKIAEEQDHNNSPDKTGLVEEVNTLNENITEASTMCHDTSIGAKGTDGKTNVAVEDILDEVVAPKMVALAPGTDTKSADTCEAQNMSLRAASEKIIESSPKLISNSETTIDDMRLCDEEENMQIGFNTEQVVHSQEVLLEEPSMVVMKDDEDFQQFTSQDLQVADMEICDMQLGVNKGQVDHSQEVFHTKPSEDIYMGFSDSEENMQFGVNEEQGDHCQEVVVVMKDKDDLVQVVSEDTQVDDKGFSDEEENMQICVNEEQVNYSQEVLHAEASLVAMKDDEDCVQVASEDIKVDVMGLCEVDENMQIGIMHQMDALDNAPRKESDADGKKIAEHFLRNYKMVASEENSQEVVNQEKVNDDNQEQHPTTPTSYAHVVSGEFGNILVEGEVEKLRKRTFFFEDTSETRKIGNEAEKSDYNNSLDVTLLHTSLKESSGVIGLLEDVNTSNEYITEGFTTCLDTSIGVKDTDEKTKVTVEDIVDGTPVDAHKMVAPGTDTKSAETCEAQKMSMSPASGKMFQSSFKLISDSETAIDDMGFCDVDENIQIGVNNQQVDHSHEVLHEEPSMVTSQDLHVADIRFCDMKENMQLGYKEQVDHNNEISHTTPSVVFMHEDLVRVVLEDMQVGVNKDQADHSQKVLHEESSADTCEAQNMSMRAASEKMIADMGLCDVEEKMQIGFNTEQVDHSQEVLLEEPSMVVMKDDDDLQQVTSKDLQVADMGVCDMEENMQLGIHEVLHTSPSVVFMNEDLVQVVSEDTQVDDMGFSDVEENMQIGVNEDQGDNSREVLHAEASVVVMKDDEDSVQVASEDIQVDGMGFSDMEENMQIGIMHQMDALDNAPGKESDPDGKKIAEHFLKNPKMVASEENLQEGVNQEKVDDGNPEQHPTTPSSYAHAVTEEFGNYLVEGEVEKLNEKTFVFEATSETGNVGDEAEKQDHKNSPDVSPLHTSLKESSGVTGLVEEAKKLDENENICAHGAVNKNSNISEASTMCHDTSIGAKGTDGKTNVTVEDILDEVSSSSFEDSDGTPVRFHPTDTSDLDAHKMVAPGTDTKSADTCEARTISMSPASEKITESSPKLINKSETAIDEMEIYDMEENTHLGVDKEQVDHTRDVFHTKPSVEIMIEDLVQVVSEDMQVGVNKDQIEHSQEVLHAEPSVVVMKDDEDLLQVASQDLQVADMELCVMEENMQLGVNKGQIDDIEVDNMGFSDVEETMQIGINEDQVDHRQEVLQAESSGVVMKDKDDLVQLGSADIQVDDMGFSDMEENMQIGFNKEQVNYDEDSVQEVLHAEPSVVLKNDDEDSVQVASEDIQVNDMGLCDVEENMQIGIMHQMGALDTCEEVFELSQKIGQIADQEDCTGSFPDNNLEASVSKNFEAETYFDVSTLGDVVINCTMNEIMQSGKMKKENSQEECSFNRLFENSDVPDDTSGIGAEAENQSYMMSHKRKRNDVDDANGPNSAENEKADGFVSTMTQLGEMESRDFNLHQVFASDTANGDEGTCYQEKLESPPKGTPIESSKKNIIFSPKFHGSSMMNKGLENESSLPLISASDMKENIKIDKMDQVGSIMSKSKFAKRQPLQDLQQN